MPLPHTAPVAPSPPQRMDQLRWLPRALAAAGLVAVAFLLFWNLGAYGLWDDEANTAIFASNVWKTGDTSAYDGDNIIAFREGLELAGIKNRAYPPLQYFYAAPFLGLLGRNAFAARAPFALAGLLGFAFWGFWLCRSKQSPWLIALSAVFALGNASLFLYSRQSRYYPLAWALTLALAYLYVNRHESQRNRLLLCVGSVALVACHFLTYGAAMICLAVDYLAFEIWKRNDTWKQRAIFCVSQAVGFSIIVGIFFPFGRKVTDYVPVSWWSDKLRLFVWNLRDLNACEYLFTPMLGLALLVALVRRDGWLVRGVLALVVFAFMASLLSPQPVGWTSVADIRYMSTTIPLGLFLSARAVWLGFRLDRPRLPLAVAALLVAAFLSFTNLAQAWFQDFTQAPTRLEGRSTTLTWLHELVSPQRSAFAESSAWLNANLHAGSHVWSMPNFTLYPLMFHAPQHLYMWQFDDDKRAAFPMLPDHHFRWHGVPDAIVAYGADSAWQVRGLLLQLAAQRGGRYQEIRLDVSPDSTRPELFWRTFVTVPPAPGDGTFIFRRVGS